MTSLIRYLVTREDHNTVGEEAASEIDLKYDIEGYTRFFDPDGYPAVKPPWGTLNAVDLNKGTIAWEHPLGEHPELAAQGMRDTGSWNYGGPIVTASGAGLYRRNKLRQEISRLDVRLTASCSGRRRCPLPETPRPRLMR